MDPYFVYLALFMSAVIFSLGLWLQADGKKRIGIGMFERIVAFWFILAGIGSFVCLLVLLAAVTLCVPMEDVP